MSWFRLPGWISNLWIFVSDGASAALVCAIPLLFEPAQLKRIFPSCFTRFSRASSHWVSLSMFYYFLTRMSYVWSTNANPSHSCATMLCTHQPYHLSNRLIPSFSLCSPVLLNPFVHVLPETLAASPSWPAAFVSCTRFPLQSLQ